MIPAGTLSQGNYEYVITIGNGDSFESLNLRSHFLSLHPGVTSRAQVRFIISGNALLRATSTSVATTTGNWPAGSVLNLDMTGGVIAGIGGAGGAGSSYDYGISYHPGFPGQAGGVAFVVTHPISINNTGGIIAGGGGGGGGGGYGRDNFFAASGGGGGGGSMLGIGGAAGAHIPYNDGYHASPGSNATTSHTGANGGAGGFSGGNDFGKGGAGGKGGDLGSPGNNGGTGIGSDEGHPGGIGGAAGSAIIGNSMVTWINVGDVRGALVS